jgi:hypothetical protein
MFSPISRLNYPFIFWIVPKWFASLIIKMRHNWKASTYKKSPYRYGNNFFDGIHDIFYWGQLQRNIWCILSGVVRKALLYTLVTFIKTSVWQKCILT